MVQVDMWSRVINSSNVTREYMRWVMLLVEGNIFFRICLFGSIVVPITGITWWSKPLSSSPGLLKIVPQKELLQLATRGERQTK